MPAELGRLCEFSNKRIHMYINFRRNDFLGSLFTVAPFVCRSVYTHDIEQVEFREPITELHTILTMEYFRYNFKSINSSKYWVILKKIFMRAHFLFPAMFSEW